MRTSRISFAGLLSPAAHVKRTGESNLDKVESFSLMLDSVQLQLAVHYSVHVCLAYEGDIVRWRIWVVLMY